MSREVDERKKRKALRKIRKAALLAEQGLGPPLSDWEEQFLEEVEARIEKYGSAFHDMEKGGSDEALSTLQQIKLREIDKKSRGKGANGFGRKSFKPKQTRASNSRDISEDLDSPPPPETPQKPEPQALKVVTSKPSITPSTPDTPRKDAAKPKLKLITGGADKA